MCTKHASCLYSDKKLLQHSSCTIQRWLVVFQTEEVVQISPHIVVLMGVIWLWRTSLKCIILSIFLAAIHLVLHKGRDGSRTTPPTQLRTQLFTTYFSVRAGFRGKKSKASHCQIRRRASKHSRACLFGFELSEAIHTTI